MIYVESSSDGKSNDDSNSSGLEIELLDNVGNAVAEEYEISTTPQKSEPNQLDSMAEFSNPPKDEDISTNIEIPGNKVNVLVCIVPQNHLKIEKMKDNL